MKQARLDKLNFKKIQVKENTFQQVEVLKRNRKKRAKQGLFVVESVAAIKAAKEHGWQFEFLCFSFEQDLSDWALGFLEESGAALIGFSQELMAELCDKAEGSEILAVVKTQPDELNRITVDGDAIIAILDRPINPGNLGSTIRSANAFGAAGLIVAGHAADVYDPVSVRSSLGALFAMPVVRVGSPDEVSDWLKSQAVSVRLLGTSVKASKAPHQVSFSKPLALLFGNETVGLSARFEELCDEFVAIPMRGVASSVNLSCAASIFMYLAASSE